MYAIVDIETTGGYAASNGITEIAIFIHDGSRVVKKFETLVNPQQLIPRYITALTGIDNHMVADAPSFEEVADTIYELLSGKIFIAHNVNFDFSFIRQQLKACGYEWNPKKLCTVRLARKVFPGFPSYSLGNLCRSLNIANESRHRAGGDALATAVLFDHMLANNGQLHIDQMLKKTSSEQWLPLHLDKQMIETLPQKPGVYYFHNNKDKVLYVGKAINLKKRVSSHFTQHDPHSKRQHFIRHIHKITYKQCATELEAIVFESTEIKRLWPRYNRSQKQPQQKFALYTFEDGRGYTRLAIDKKKKNLPALYNFNLLHEGQTLLKKMIEEFELNSKLCFIDKTQFTEEDQAFLDPPMIYNGKVRTALQALDEQLPSFALVDEGISENEKLCLLMERGSFWGMGYIPGDIEINSSETLKTFLHPYPDNDYIRNSIYSFAATNPDKKIMLVN